MSLNEQQFSYAPNLTSAKVAGILRKNNVPRYTRKPGSKSILRDVNRQWTETSGVEIEPESREKLVHPGSKTTRPIYKRELSGRYAISYTRGYSRKSAKRSPEEVFAILESAKSAFTNAGLNISPHHRENTFWVHE